MTPEEAQLWGDNLLLLPKRNPICLEELLVSSSLILSVDFCEDSWSWVRKGSEAVVPSHIENMTGQVKSETPKANKSNEIEKTKKDKKKLNATKKVLVPKRFDNMDNSANENKSEISSNDTYEEVDLFAHLRSAAVLPTKPLKRKRLSGKPSKPPEAPNNQVPDVMATDGRSSAKRVRFDLDKNTLHQWDKDPDLGPIKTVEDIHNEAAPMKISDKLMLGPGSSGVTATSTHQVPDLRPIIDPTKGYARLPDLPLFADKAKSVPQTAVKKDNLPNVLPFIPPPPTTKVVVSNSSLSLTDDVVSDEYVDSLLESVEPKLREVESKNVQYPTALLNQVLNPNCKKNTELTSHKSEDFNCAYNVSTLYELMDISDVPALNTPAEKHGQQCLSLPLEILALPAIDEYKCGYVHSANYVKSCVSYVANERSFQAEKSCLMSLIKTPMEKSAPVKLNELNFTMPFDSAPVIPFTPPSFPLHGQPLARMHTAHGSSTQAHSTLISHLLPIPPPPPPPLPPLPPPPPLPPTLITDCISNLFPVSSYNLNCLLPSPPLPPPPMPPVPGYSNTSQSANCSFCTTNPLSISLSAAEADVDSDIDERDMDISSDVESSDLSTSNSKREGVDKSLAPENMISDKQKSVLDGAEQSVDKMNHDSDQNPEDDWLSLEDDVPLSYSSHVQSPSIINCSGQVETSHAMNGCKGDGGINHDIKVEKTTNEDTFSSTTVENLKKVFQRKVCEDFLQRCLGSSNDLSDPILDSEEELSRVNNLGMPLFNNVDIRIGKNNRVDIQLTSTYEDKKPAGLKPRALFWETCPVNYDYCQCLAVTFSREPSDRPIDTGFQDQEQIDSLRLAIAYSNTKPEQNTEHVIGWNVDTIYKHIAQNRLEVLNNKVLSVMEERDNITTQGNTDSDIKKKSICNLQQIVSSNFNFKVSDTIKAENRNHCNTRNHINISHIELALELARKMHSHALSFDEAEDILTKRIEGD